ncbi:MAG TPA: PspC domain-containing protein, partial [Candidatus Polarisedimenticolia bacterium]|nr:PspC domain-containing protein [Candidatus Polarisedimenticolia bacterium]
MSAQRRLYRLRDEGKIAGVCAGIADYLDVDPVAVRLAAVLLAVLVPPAGLIGYIACWVIMPEGAPGSRPSVEPAPAGEPAGAAGGPEAGPGPAAAPAPPGP